MVWPLNLLSSGLEELGLAVGFDIKGGIANYGVQIGYAERDFDQDAVYNDVSAITFDAYTLAMLTPKTSLELRAKRDIRTTSLDVQSAMIRTEATAELQHELRDNLLLRGKVGRGINSFRPADAATAADIREDDTYEAEAGVRYLFSENLLIDFGIDVSERESTIDSGEFTRQQVMLSLTAKL